MKLNFWRILWRNSLRNPWEKQKRFFWESFSSRRRVPEEKLLDDILIIFLREIPTETFERNMNEYIHELLFWSDFLNIPSKGIMGEISERFSEGTHAPSSKMSLLKSFLRNCWRRPRENPWSYFKTNTMAGMYFRGILGVINWIILAEVILGNPFWKILKSLKESINKFLSVSQEVIMNLEYPAPILLWQHFLFPWFHRPLCINLIRLLLAGKCESAHWTQSWKIRFILIECYPKHKK